MNASKYSVFHKLDAAKLYLFLLLFFDVAISICLFLIFKIKNSQCNYAEICIFSFNKSFTPILSRYCPTHKNTNYIAGQSTTYSIGMSLNNKDLFKSDKWGRNVLGNLLMKVREDLL